MFRLAAEEFDSLRSQFATLKTGSGQHGKFLPYAFTEHGAIMAAMVLAGRARRRCRSMEGLRLQFATSKRRGGHKL